jgi:hypothetical protein
LVSASGERDVSGRRAEGERVSEETAADEGWAVPRGQVFGEWDAPITDGDERIETPVGNTCVWCAEAIAEGDNGRIAPMGYTEHRECSLRQVMGGIGHLVDHPRYCRGALGTDAGLSHRDSALLVWEYFQDTHLEPSEEQVMAWKLRLGAPSHPSPSPASS